MIFSHLIHVRLYGSAISKNIRAAVTEQATTGEVEQRRHHTGDGAEEGAENQPSGPPEPAVFYVDSFMLVDAE